MQRKWPAFPEVPEIGELPQELFTHFEMSTVSQIQLPVVAAKGGDP
jgi:hypothetical protein